MVEADGSRTSKRTEVGDLKVAPDHETGDEKLAVEAVLAVSSE